MRRREDGYVHTGRGLVGGHEEGEKGGKVHVLVGQRADEPLDVGQEVHRHGALRVERPLVQQEQQQVDAEGLRKREEERQPSQNAASHQFALVWLEEKRLEEYLGVNTGR